MNFSPIEVNTDNFTPKVIDPSANTPVLVEFYTTWCPFCQELSPRLEKLASEYNLLVAKVDLEQNPELAQKYNVQSFPDVRLIDKGEVTDGFLGALPNPLILDFFYTNELQPEGLVSLGKEHDTLVGEAGNDKIDGGGGNDKLSGLKGNDQLYGNAGNDNLGGGAGEDYLWGGGGKDYLWGGAGNDFLRGESGNDLLKGGSKDDLLVGDSGSDTLIGGMGNDVLTGVNQSHPRPGRGEIDILNGSAGKDTFVLATRGKVFYDDGNLAEAGTNDYAKIRDFTIGTDVIVLAEGFNYRLGSSPVTNQSDTGIFIDNPSNMDELIGVIRNVEPQSLDLSNTEQFIFV